MKKYKIEIAADVKGQKNVDKLNDSLEDTQKEQENVSEGFSEMGGAADAAVGGAVGKFQGLKAGIVSAVKSLGVLKVAVAATGLGLFLLIIASIKAAFTSTEAGQNKFNKLMNALGVITGNLIDLLASLGNTIISAFEDPQQALKDFWEALKQNVVVRINSVMDMFGLLGKAIKQVFEGDFSGAMESAKQAGSKYVDAMTGVEDSINKATGAVTGFIEETKNEIEISNELSDAQANLDKKIREQLINRAKLEGEIATARLNALDDEKFGLEERIGFLDGALKKTNEIFDAEVEIAKERLRQVAERNKLSGSTKEDLELEAQLEADLIRLEAEKQSAKRMTFSQVASLRRQDAAEKEAAAKAEVDLEIKKQKEIQDAIDKAAAEAKIKKAKDLKLATEAEALAWSNMFASMDAAGAGWLATLTSGIKTAMDEIEETGKLSTEGIMAVTGASLKAGSQLVNMIASQIDVSSREGFEKQKKLRVAGAIMDSFSAAIAGMLAGLSVGGPWGIALGAITAASSLAFGMAQVGKIKKQQFGGGGGGGGGSAPRVSTPTSAPSLSLVSPATSGESQLSQQIGADAPPTKAYVVSEDMSSQQSLDRNIESKSKL